MGFDLEKRLASELNRLADDTAGFDKDTRSEKRLEKLKRIAEELKAKLLGGELAEEEAPGKRTVVDDVRLAFRRLESTARQAEQAFKTIPWQQRTPSFDDYRASGLRDVLARLSDHK